MHLRLSLLLSIIFRCINSVTIITFNQNNRSELKTITRRQWGFGFISGLFLAAYYVLWFESLQYTSVASSTVIVTLQPLFSMIGGYFYSRKGLREARLSVVSSLFQEVSSLDGKTSKLVAKPYTEIF